MPTNKLKPCPFCGNKPKWSLSKKMYDQLHGEPYQYVLLTCCIINIAMPDKNRAAELWNERYDTQ